MKVYGLLFTGDEFPAESADSQQSADDCHPGYNNPQFSTPLHTGGRAWPTGRYISYQPQPSRYRKLGLAYKYTREKSWFPQQPGIRENRELDHFNSQSENTIEI